MVRLSSLFAVTIFIASLAASSVMADNKGQGSGARDTLSPKRKDSGGARDHSPHKHPHGGHNGRGPVVEDGPMTGGKKDVTGSNDVHLQQVSEFVSKHLASENSSLHFVQSKAEVQVVAGLMYTLYYKGNDDHGVCQEKRTLVVYDKPWANERTIKSDTKTECT